MEPNWAEENLKVIRTLMERSAMYRRALAPVMLMSGILGLAGAGAGIWWKIETINAFVLHWIAIAVAVVLLTLWIVRGQALKAREAFWSPPARRIAVAMCCPIVAAIGLTVPLLRLASHPAANEFRLHTLPFIAFWLVLYGCALHAAGSYISRGVRLLSWAFLAAGCAYFFQVYALTIQFIGDGPWWVRPHIIMGLTFGGFHLIAGIYLYFTEKSRNAQ